MKGKINWFDTHSGHGCIISDDNIWYRIHEFTELNSRELNTGDRVEFTLAIDSIHPIVKTVIK